MVIFVIGGIKSGKSRFALKEAEALEVENFYFIATAKPIDEEMKSKIEKHKKERSSKWITIEEPIELDKVLKGIPLSSAVIIDCVTTWLTNLMVEKEDIKPYIKAFIEALKVYKKRDSYVFVVSNETGLGIVPETELGRRFINTLGLINQEIMKLSDRAFLMVAGVPLKLK